MPKPSNKLVVTMKNSRPFVQLLNLVDIIYVLINLVLELLFLKSISYNTLRVHALTYSEFAEYCKSRGIDYSDISQFKRWFGDIIPDYIIWLKETKKNSEKTIYRKIRQVIKLYYLYFLTIDTPDLMPYIKHMEEKYSRKGFLGRRLIRKPRYFRRITPEEFDKLLAACNNQRDRVIIIMLYMLGLRVGELLTLRWEDLKPMENRIIINGAPNYYSHAYAKSGYRKIAAPNEIFDLLEKYKQELKNNNRLSSEYIFATRVDKPMPIKYAAIRSLLLTLTEKTGIYLHAHMFRKTCAQNLLLKGVSRKAIRDQLGHAHMYTTDEYYLGFLWDDIVDDILEENEKYKGGRAA